jgi:hypothetical protein
MDQLFEKNCKLVLALFKNLITIKINQYFYLLQRSMESVNSLSASTNSKSSSTLALFVVFGLGSTAFLFLVAIQTYCVVLGERITTISNKKSKLNQFGASSRDHNVRQGCFPK